MQIVYVLQSAKDNNLYIGCTSNLKNRLISHLSGRVLSTKSRLPLKLVYKEEYTDKYEAYRMERFYKTAVGKRVLRKNINNWEIV